MLELDPRRNPIEQGDDRLGQSRLLPQADLPSMQACEPSGVPSREATQRLRAASKALTPRRRKRVQRRDPVGVWPRRKAGAKARAKPLPRPS